MNNNLINYLILFELSIFTIYLTNLFFAIFLDPKKIDRKLNFFLWMIFGIIVFFQEYFVNVNFNLISNLIIIPIIYKIYNVGLKKVIYLFALYLVIFFAVELLIFGIVSLLIKEFYGSFYFSSLISKIGLLIIFKFLKHYFGRDFSPQYGTLFLSIPILSTIIIYILNPKDATNSEVSQNIIVFSAFIIIVNLLFFYINDLLIKESMNKRQKMIFEQNVLSIEKQINEREENFLKFRKKKHDMKNHLIYINELIKENNKSDALKYIGELLKDVDFNGEKELKTQNIVIDALLSHKIKFCKKNNIEFRVKEIAIPYKLSINDADLCMILGNLLDNAVEAVLKIKNELKKYIEISMLYKKNVLSILIVNTYNGDVKETRGGDLLTTKADKENHGIGIMSMKMAAQKYNGQVRFTYDNKKFNIYVILYL